MSLAAEVRNTEADRLAALLRQRYRSDPPAADAPWSEAIDAILDHRSARAYLPDALPVGTLARARAIAGQYNAPGDGLDYIESFLLAALDAALAAQNAVVAADSLRTER